MADKERRKDVLFMIMSFFILLLSLKLSAGEFTNDYPHFTGVDNDGTDIYLGTGDSAFYSDYTNENASANNIRNGDVTGDGIAEVITYDLTHNKLYVMSLTLDNVRSVNVTDTYRGFNLYDIDADGILEVIYLGDAGSFGFVRVYEYSGGTLVLKHAGQNLSNDISVSHNPVCIAEKCYFVDATGIVYEYDADANTFTESHGTGSGIRGDNIIIDDCSPAWSGDELIYIVDSDVLYGAGGYVIVDLNTMDSHITSELHNMVFTGFTGSLHGTLLCEQIEGNTYIFYSQWSNNPNSGSCYVDSKWSNQVWLGHDQVHANNSVENIHETTLGASAGGSAYGNYCGVSVGAGTSQPFLYDVDEDGTDDACVVWSYTSGCGGSSCRNWERVRCYNISNLVEVESNAQQTLGTLKSSDWNTYVVDYDGNAQDDFLVGGKYYTPASNTWSTISGIPEYISYYSPAKYGTDCISYYYGALGGVEGRQSTTFSCDYGTPPVSGFMPTITYVDYSETAIDINDEDTIEVDAVASDPQSDDIYWAYTCDYSGETDPIRTSEEYMDSGTNITELKERFNIDLVLCNETAFPNVFEVDSLIGYAWNISTDPDGSCITDFSRNLTSGVGLSSNIITTHFLSGDIPALGGENGLFIAGRDGIGNFMWGLHINYDGTSFDNEIFRLNSDGDFIFLDGSNNYQDRIYIDVDMDSQRYRVRVDENLDVEMDFVSAWYDLIQPIHTVYHDNYFFTTAMKITTGDDFWDLVVNTPEGTQWIDTLFVEYTDLPLFGVTPGTTFDYDCVYSGIGNFEIRTWVTDDDHANNYTSYESQNIQVVQGTTPVSVDCSGYSPPSCTGSCYFYDDWETNYSISCIGWEGGDEKYPYNEMLRVEQTDMNGLSIYLPYSHTDNGFPIYAEEYDTFTINFDFIVNDADYRTSFIVYDSTITNTLIYVYWEDENFYVIGSGGIENIFSYNEGNGYNIEMIVDLRDQEVTYVLDSDVDSAETVSFYDSNVESSGYYYFSPVDFNEADMYIDEFEISFGDSNPDFDGDVDVDDDDYTYNSNYFCGINWTRDPKPNYISTTCVDRGWSDDSYRSFFCFPRACIQDFGFSLKSWFMNNIFMAIIVILLFVLIVPLYISYKRNKN